MIALMQDQVSALQQLGIQAAFLNSTVAEADQQTTMQQIEQGTLDLLYIAPERLLQRHTLAWLQHVKIALIAIDEAHCVSQWGHDFRQDYLALDVLTTVFPGVPRLALTATADPRTQQEIIDRLQLHNARRFISGFDRPNIRYTVRPKTDARRQLLPFLNAHRNESGIVYCMSRKKVDQ
ncbi:MAG: DEAD/DEAH box helicase, partial [Wenzhouxiangellaceae bacterium]